MGFVHLAIVNSYAYALSGKTGNTNSSCNVAELPEQLNWLEELFTVQLPMLITKHNVTLLCARKKRAKMTFTMNYEFTFRADELERLQGSENET
jgi:hypothetical protein